MQKIHVDLRQLRHFSALIEHRSFVAGAAAVNLSQSAFSRSIQTLENAAGCQLVDRGHKDLPPTKQGKVVLEYARRLLREAHNLGNEIRNFNDAESGALRFGCGPAPAGSLVPRATARFVQRYPKARVSFTVDNWEGLDRRLCVEEIEFFVADTRYFEANPDYRTVRLAPRRWGFCCRAGHPLTRLPQVVAADLLAWPLVTSMRPPNIRKMLAELSGDPDYAPALQCEHGYALLEVVRQSDAIGIAIDCNREGSIGEGDLVVLNVPELAGKEEMYTRYGIVSRAARPLSPLAQAQIAMLLEADRDMGDCRPAGAAAGGTPPAGRAWAGY